MKNFSKLVLDPFCFNQFDKKSGAAAFLDYDRLQFIDKVNSIYNPDDLKEGYAPFCKHLFIKNFTPAKLGYLKIEKDNEHLVRSKYEARTEKELPVLVRYFSANDVQSPIAEYLDIILYSKEQIQKENEAMGSKDPNANIEYEWAIIYVKPQMGDQEIPMDPITIMRNTLGKEHGGSGVDLDKDKYMESVNFWSQHALIKETN